MRETRKSLRSRRVNLRKRHPATAKKWEAVNQDRRAKQATARYRALADDKLAKRLATQKLWYENNKERVLNAKYVREYGITWIQAKELLDNQGGVCAICGNPPERSCVDHCHKYERETGGIKNSRNTLS